MILNHPIISLKKRIPICPKHLVAPRRCWQAHRGARCRSGLNTATMAWHAPSSAHSALVRDNETRFFRWRARGTGYSAKALRLPFRFLSHACVTQTKSSSRDRDRHCGFSHQWCCGQQYGEAMQHFQRYPGISAAQGCLWH